MKSALRTVSIWLLVTTSATVAAQSNRITAPIDAAQSVVLKGSVHAQARPEYDQGEVDPSLPLPYVVMAMKPSATQQVELGKLLAEQQDSSSPNYHKWLTPERYADRFGLSGSDTDKVSNWLRSQGFTIVQVARGRDWIAFAGTAGLVGNTFHTQIHRYSVDGELRFGNATELAIPKVLAGTVAGIRGLNDFRVKPMGVREVARPGLILPVLRSFFTNGGGVNGSNFLAPDDIATIYDFASIAGIDGTGMKLVIVGQVAVVMADIQAFRTGFGLPVNNPTVTIVPGTTPGTSQDDLLESDLDLEWAGAVARNANVIFVTSNDVFSSAFYAIDNDLAPVISMSYGGCEILNGGNIAATEPSMQKANAEGITFIASSGDSGPAGCDPAGNAKASMGLSVSYPASSPEVTGLGGTEFNGDVPDPTPYWNSVNGTNLGSAIMYIPETSWNDTPARNMLSASGGGKSSCHTSPCTTGFPKPSWQTGTGVPADGVRDVPDVSFTSSPDHDGYIVCSSGGPPGGTCPGGIGNGFLLVGGTSASAPVFAGIVTLLNQELGNLPPLGLGNINPTLYKLAQTPANNVFHDVTTGNNIVPCTQGTPNCPNVAPFQYGFSAGAGYDQVTGLGSIDVSNLFNNWNAGKTATATVLSVTPATIVLGSTQNLMLTATVSPNSGSGTPTGTVGFFLNGKQSVGTGMLSKGTASLSYNPESLAAGVNNFTAVYGADANFTNSTSVAEMVTVQDFTVAASPTTVTVSAPGQSGTSTLTITPEFGFSEAVSFTCTTTASEATCSAPSVTPNGAPIMATLTITTAGPAAGVHFPKGSGLFYALLIPGLLGVMLLSQGKNGLGHTRFLGLMVGLVCLTLWLPACGGGSSALPPAPPDPGTPVGNSTVTVTAAGTGGAPSHSVKLTLTVK
jgi:subtilase family serine protease